MWRAALPLWRSSVQSGTRGSLGEQAGALTSLIGPFAGQSRAFIQLRTELVVADNSGAKRVMCIKVLKGAKPNAAGLGDVIIASVKDALPRGKVRKGEVVTCVVVRTAVPTRRADGSLVRFDDSAAVIVTKAGEPLGTRVFGPVPHELRARNGVAAAWGYDERVL